jgi:hypothetical protein
VVQLHLSTIFSSQPDKKPIAMRDSVNRAWRMQTPADIELHVSQSLERKGVDEEDDLGEEDAEKDGHKLTKSKSRWWGTLVHVRLSELMLLVLEKERNIGGDIDML